MCYFLINDKPKFPNLILCLHKYYAGNIRVDHICLDVFKINFTCFTDFSHFWFSSICSLLTHVTGDNLLALVRAIGNSSFLVNPGEYRHGQQVYFDIVGLIMINYPARIGVIINTVTALVVFMGVVRKVILGNRKQGQTFSTDTYINP